MSEYIGGSPDSILERMQRDSERRSELEHERQIALIRLQSHALVWTGAADDLIVTITKWYESRWLLAPSLQEALQHAAYHFLKPDGSAVISPPSTIPKSRPSERFKRLDEDYQVIEFDGRQYGLTSIQASVIGVLHTAHQSNRSSVGLNEIYKAMKVNSGRMSQWFRGKNKTLYGLLIVRTASRNHYRLVI